MVEVKLLKGWFIIRLGLVLELKYGKLLFVKIRDGG